MIRLLMAVSALAVASPVAAADVANPLTHGMAQMTLHVGKTTQYEVLEAFGGPNVSTLDGDGREVWIYDRFATVSMTKDSGFSVGFLGGAVGGAVGAGVGLGFSNKKSKASSSSRSMTLILKFGADKKLADFKSRSSSF
jgi:opacity protein-like surface antigen